MSRILQQPIEGVTLDKRKAPASFRWQGRRYRVAVVHEAWREAGMWWADPPEPDRTLWRVELVGGGLCELQHDDTGQWWLYRLWD